MFKDAVALLSHSLFRIQSHWIAPDSTSNGSNRTGWQGTSNHILKICLVTLTIAKNYKNKIAVDKEVNYMMKVIHGIERDTNRVKYLHGTANNLTRKLWSTSKVVNTPRQKLVNTYVPSKRDNREKEDNMLGLNYLQVMTWHCTTGIQH